MFSVANRRTMLLMIGILAFALVCVMCRRTEGFMRRRDRPFGKRKRKNTNDELTEEDKRQRLEDKRQRQTDRRQNKKDRQLERTDIKLKQEDRRQNKKDRQLERTDRTLKQEDTQIKTKIGDLKRTDKKLKKQIKEKSERGTILALKDRITQLENPFNYNPA